MRLRRHHSTKRRLWRGAQVLATVLIATHFGSAAEPADDIHHPRLYFTAADLPQLRELKKSGTQAKIWANIISSADWCAKQRPRTEWIASVEKDP